MRREKRKTKRQIKNEQFQQKKAAEQKMQQLDITQATKQKRRRVGGAPLDEASANWVSQNLRKAKSDSFICRVLDLGYGGTKYTRGPSGSYELRAIEAVDHKITDVNRDHGSKLNRPNRIALTTAINEFRSGADASEVVAQPVAAAQQPQSIQRIDASRFVLKDEIGDIIKAEVARIQSAKPAPSTDAFSQEVESKISNVKTIMTRWVAFKCEMRGTQPAREDYSREYGKLYEKVEQVQEISIPRAEDLAKIGDKIIRWLARGGHIDVTLAIAKRSFAVEAN